MTTRLNSLRQLRRVGTVAVGNFGGAGLGFVLLVLLARTLPPTEFVVVAGIIVLIDGGQLLLDTVFNAGTVTVASRDGVDEKTPSEPALRAGLWGKLLGGILFAAIIAALAVPLSIGLADDRSLVWPVIAAGVAASFAGLHSFIIAVKQTRGEFGGVAALSATKNLLRVLLVLPLALIGAEDGAFVALLICLASPLAFAVSAPFITWHFLGDVSPLAAEFKKHWKINRWMALLSVSVFAGRLDVWLVALLSNAHQAALYAVASQLCVGVGVLTQSFITTYLPQVSRFKTTADMWAFLRQSLNALPIIILLWVGAAIFSEPIVQLVFGDGYAGSAAVFNVLLAASLMTLVGTPLMLLLLSIGEARIFAIGGIGQLGIRVSLALLLVPTGGAIGIAAADIVSRILAMSLIGLFVWNALRRLDVRTP